MWVHLPAHRAVTWDAQGYRGYVGHGQGCSESSVSLDPTIHNSTPVVGGRGPGAWAGLGFGFGEHREEGWMTGFNNRWDHEGEMADESKKKGRERRIRSHPRTRRRDARHTQSESDKPCKGEKRENTIKQHRQETSQCWLLHHPFPPGSQSMISQ